MNSEGVGVGIVALDDFGRGRCAGLGFAGGEAMTSSCFAVLRTGSREEPWSRKQKEVDSVDPSGQYGVLQNAPPFLGIFSLLKAGYTPPSPGLSVRTSLLTSDECW